MTPTPRLAKPLVALAALIVLMTAVGSASLQAQTAAPTLTLTAPSSPQPVTGVINIPITVSNVASLGAFEFDLSYDKSLITVTGLTVNPFLGQSASCNPSTARCAVALGPLDQGTALSLGGYTYGAGAGANGVGVVAVLHIQPTGASGTTTLQITNALFSDVNGNPATPTTQDASLTVTTTFKLYLPIIRR